MQNRLRLVWTPPIRVINKTFYPLLNAPLSWWALDLFCVTGMIGGGLCVGSWVACLAKMALLPPSLLSPLSQFPLIHFPFLCLRACLRCPPCPRPYSFFQLASRLGAAACSLAQQLSPVTFLLGSLVSRILVRTCSGRWFSASLLVWSRPKSYVEALEGPSEWLH